MCGQQFTGKSLGIVGLGRIGMATAHRLIPFGFQNILYHGRKSHAEKEKQLEEHGRLFQLSTVTFQPSLQELVRQCDVICVCCALNEHTKHLFNKSIFTSMNKTALLVNTSRGAVVDMAALEEFLAANTEAGAALDVVCFLFG